MHVALRPKTSFIFYLILFRLKSIIPAAVQTIFLIFVIWVRVQWVAASHARVYVLPRFFPLCSGCTTQQLLTLLLSPKISYYESWAPWVYGPSFSGLWNRNDNYRRDFEFYERNWTKKQQKDTVFVLHIWKGNLYILRKMCVVDP